MKKCSKCHRELSIKSFHHNKSTKDGYAYYCKKCSKEVTDRWQQRNIERVRETARLWAKNNPERMKELVRKWTTKNIKKIRERGKLKRKENPEKDRIRQQIWVKNNPERMKALTKNWRKNNPEKVKAIQKKANSKRRQTAEGRLKHNIATEIYLALKQNKNGNHWGFLVGYTLDQLKRHLEKQFKEGMSWENYGQWHLDHIIPQSAFNFEKPEDDDFKRCWALSNLQPLWASDNRKKWAKIDRPMQPNLIFNKKQE